MITSFIGIIVAAILIVLIELRHLKKSKSVREIVVFSVLLLTGTIIGLLYSAGYNVTSPLHWISVVFKPINHFISNLLNIKL